MKANLLLLTAIASILTASLHSADEAKSEISKPAGLAASEGFTINYNTVSILEYIRFAGKICKVNFIYEETDLNFTVTVVSDEPVTANNVMATLIQVLRIHGLMLLEQDNNLVIHKAADVKQIATLVTDSSKQGNAPIVTRIFRLNNAKPDSVAAIIRPMISGSALLEVSAETRQLIITDITANVDKIAALIENLDSPHTMLEIKSFEAQHNKPDFLIELGSQIMTPISLGSPFILVPQNLANTIFIVSTPELVQKAIQVFTNLDTPPKKELASQRNLKSENIFIYKALHRSGDEILTGLTNIVKSLQQSGTPDSDLVASIDSAKWIRETNTIMFVGSKSSIDKTKEFLTALDVPSKETQEKTSFFLYKPQFRTVQEVEKSILEMVNNLKGAKGADDSLVETIESVKINPSTHTLTFSGEEKNFSRVKELLATIDTSTGKVAKPSAKNNFFVYKIQQAPDTEIESSLKNLAKHLDKSNAAEDGLIESIQNMKYLKETNSIVFTGSDTALKRLQELVPSFDTGIGPQVPPSSQFYIYKPLHQKGDQLSVALKDVTNQLKTDKLADPALIRTLESQNWVKSTNSLMFTGDPASLKKVETLIASLDIPTGPKPAAEKNFFLYQPQYASREKTEGYLRNLSDNLSKNHEDELAATIRSMKWIDPSRSFMFHGSDPSLARLKELLKSFDTPEAKEGPKPGYYIYKVQNTTGDLIEEDLDQLVKNFKSSGVQDPKLLDVIEKIRYVKETNSLLLTGDPQALDEVKKLIAEYDYPRVGPKGPVNSNFYMYKPQHLTAVQIEKSLRDVGANLKKANLADPSLLTTIETAKYVNTTNSLIFTGPPDTLQKIQGLIKDIDVAPTAHAPIQHIGKTTFLLYKLKNASGPQIISSLKTMTADLKKSDTSDKDFIGALGSMKYVKETNSLFFTGTEEALTKVQTLVDRFDVSSLSPPKIEAPAAGPSNFFVYRPQSLSGTDLEKILHDFAENLKSSGLSDPDLFNAVNSMRWIDKTQSLVFTGSTKALDQIKDLLKTFDIPSNLPEGPVPGGPLEPSIQAIDNTSFLVYKLQFHKGAEIQGALKQIAKDLILSNAPVNQNLLNSINSIQWLEVTNSLLCSGDQETLTRLRELIKNLDIPLKQVFIEMLVIQTTMANGLNFGLEWGGNYKYRNKFAGVINNTAPPSSSAGSGGGYTPDPLFNSFQQTLIPPVAPTPQMIPASGSGAFDLGVIGEVIRHNGQTFLTLGSLLKALQTDDETSIIMTPKILTQDGRTSSIFVGENIPFAGSFVSNTASNATVSTANIEYRDIGLSLTVTPVLGNSDIVTLDINLDRSQTITDISQQTITPGATTINGITTSKTTMQTTVHVPDNNFLILSGMVNNSNTKSKAGIPCLGGLPIIGAAFSKSNDFSANSNIVIFIRPHIINSLEDMRTISSDQEAFFRDQAGTPFLEHNYDEAMELIKT
ncbi:MAG: secretin N-terminal domain-containing protein, partial [Chlamydiota bacterium]